MPNFSANLTMLFTEVDFLDRFERAARAGFTAVEFMSPYVYEAGELAAKLERHGLTQVLFNLPVGRWDAGERGIAVLPDRVGEFQEGVGHAIEYAKVLKCSRVNCLVGLTPNLPEKRIRKTLVSNLRFASKMLARENIRLLVESINTRDIPGFYLSSTGQALSLIKEVDHPNLFYQYDAYHMQIMEGNLTETIRNNLDKIAHIQIADNPGRHEPGTGEINYPNLFRFIEEAGYNGFIGCEYRPLKTTEEGLEWMRPYLGNPVRKGRP
ncbi:MAG TPA: 2-oxo-tetronate isomerase [Thermodesulfobacteriota bacterium]|nr:2-oxo-tetronate isomerase [Thermodesulfobacteriota bacterium]